MTIYAADGTVKYSVEGYNEGSKLYKQLMSHDYVVLPFTLETPFVCEIGDYMIDPQFGRYELVDEYMPIFNTNTACYDYKLRLDAYYYRWKNKLLKYSPASGSELAFTLTSTIATHANIVLDNLAQLGYTYWGDNSAFVVDFDETIDPSVAKPIQYQNVKITAALTLIAQAFECEWWVTENIIHFGHCEDTNPGDTLEIGVNVSEMSSSDSTTEFITRLYAFGSTRNLPRDYKKSEETDIVKDGIVQKRLMLPHWSDLEGKDERQMLVDNGYSLSDQFGYIDVLDKLDTMESGDPKAVEGVLIIDDIYPRTQCHVNNVETYTKPIEDEDGNPTGETQTFYKLYDDSGLHFDSDYILPNSDGLMMKFTSGKLNGMEFECIYNDDEGFYEPIVNENYGRTLPDNILRPEVGNTFVLYNWDTSRLPETGLITKASLELLRKAIEYLNEARKDSKTYTCTEECFEDDYTIREIGSAVTLVNPSYFEGERASRILGLEVNLDLPYDHPKYTCGEKAKYNVIDDQNQKIDSITLNGVSYTGTGTGIGGGSSIYLIKTNDATRPTNTNTFSALRALEEFLSAKGEDTANGVITFVKGLWVKAKGLFGIDENGNGIFNNVSAEGDAEVTGDVVVGGDARSDNFETGVRGWNIDEHGNAEFEGIRSRSYIMTEEMLINRLQGQEGDTLYTDNDQIESVRTYVDADDVTHYVLTLKEKWDGYFTAQQYGNIVKGIVNTFAAKDAGVSDYTADEYKAYQNVDNGGNLYYTSWMRVMGTHNTDSARLGVNEIDVVMYGDTDVPAQMNFPPCELMTIARRGCFLNPNDEPEGSYARQSIERRQRLFEISVTDGRIQKLTGVSSPMLANGNFGVTIGELPDFVKRYPDVRSVLKENGDYLYAQGVVVGDYIKIDKEGVPVPQHIYPTEPWVSGQELIDKGVTPTAGYGIYYANHWNEDTRQFETHYVTHNGMLWQCLQSQPVVSGATTTYYEPKWNSAYWRLVDGNENLSIEFVSSRGYSFRRGSVDTTITPHLYYGSIDISDDIAEEYWNWTRTSEYPAEGDEERDNSWASAHEHMRVLRLTNADMPRDWSSANKAIFTLTVSVNDGKTTRIVDNQIIS